MAAFDKLYLLYVLLLMAAYTAVRGAPWHDLLAALEIDAPLRSQVFAFLVGEVTKSIPIGTCRCPWRGGPDQIRSGCHPVGLRLS
jgi:hypothetical protein